MRELIASRNWLHITGCRVGGRRAWAGVILAAAVGGRVVDRADHVQHLSNRAGPALRGDQRQRVVVL
jgi:hypothetical protein